MSSSVVPIPKQSLIVRMAGQYEMEPEKFGNTIKATCIKGEVTNEDFAAFLMVAHEHKLNPITREIYAFPKKGGGIQPIVSIDGWMKMINDHPQSDGIEFEDIFSDDGKLVAIKCNIYRKDRKMAISVTEYMEECKRPTEPWQKWPARMLRHKSAIQCARYAFSFSGIIDPEEAERSPEVITGEIQAPAPISSSHPTAQTSDDDNASPSSSPAGGEALGQEIDAAGILQEAKSWFDECLNGEALEDAWGEFEHFQEKLSEEDAQHLRDMYASRLQQVEPNPLAAG